MALVPKIAVNWFNDCSTIVVSDITGAYDASANPNGYGTPNLTLAHVTTVTLSAVFYPPDGSTPINYTAVNVFPTTDNPAPFVLNEVYNLTPAIFSIGTNTWPDGIWVLQYVVNGSNPGEFYNAAPVQFLFDCNAKCCIFNKLGNIKACGCECKETEELFKYYMYLISAEAAAGCLKNGEALELLNAVENYCINTDCGCND